MPETIAPTSGMSPEFAARLRPVQEAHPYPEKLPIQREEENIKKALQLKDRVIIVGQTGSGKTTIVPQFMYELLSYDNPQVNILVTQPRRLAARSVARYVSSQLGSDVVGYRYRGANAVGDNTRITFTVDGTLLNEFQRDPLLLKYDAVMVDEVHERNLDMDIAMALLKKAQNQRRKQGLHPLKVVLASATIDKKKLADYFEDAAQFDIEGTLHPITDHFSDYEIAKEDAVAEAAKKTEEILADSTKTGDILIFMPGKAEIDATIAEIKARVNDESVEIIALLGGEQDAAAQDKIYVQDGKRKVIVATNVAETSITVPNIKFVIDSGLMRVMAYNPESGLSSLQTIEHAKSNWKQRRGRAGRVSAGEGYYLFTHDQFMARPEFTDPEIQRIDLAALVLRMKKLGIEDVYGFDFIDKPTTESVDQAIETLQQLGALDQTENITDIGMEMAEIPLDPHYARMLVEAKKRECADAVTVLIGFLSNRRSVFSYNPKNERFNEKYSRFIVTDSDFLTLINIWNEYIQHNTDKENNIKWTSTHGFSRSVLYEVSRIRRELIDEDYLRTASIGRRPGNINIEEPSMRQAIKACVTAGFADKVLLQQSNGLYQLKNAKKEDIAIDRSSAVALVHPRALVSGNLHTQERSGRTYAGFNQVVEEEDIGKEASYLKKHEQELDTQSLEIEQNAGISPQEEQVMQEVKNTVDNSEKLGKTPPSFVQEVKEFFHRFNRAISSFGESVKQRIVGFWKKIKSVLKV